MENFTPIPSFIGGLLIGLSAVILLLGQGRLAGISGILGGLLSAGSGGRPWRLLFFIGLIAGAAGYAMLGGDISTVDINPFRLSGNTQMTVLLLGGLLVGFGTQMGSGCTSGHGICGLGRFSVRSLVATGTFMATAGLTVVLVRYVFGGA